MPPANASVLQPSVAFTASFASGASYNGTTAAAAQLAADMRSSLSSYLAPTPITVAITQMSGASRRRLLMQAMQPNHAARRTAFLREEPLVLQKEATRTAIWAHQPLFQGGGGKSSKADAAHRRALLAGGGIALDVNVTFPPTSSLPSSEQLAKLFQQMLQTNATQALAGLEGKWGPVGGGECHAVPGRAE